MYSFIYDVNDFYKLNDIMVLMERHCIADVNGADMTELVDVEGSNPSEKSYVFESHYPYSDYSYGFT